MNPKVSFRPRASLDAAARQSDKFTAAAALPSRQVHSSSSGKHRATVTAAVKRAQIATPPPTGTCT